MSSIKLNKQNDELQERVKIIRTEYIAKMQKKDDYNKFLNKQKRILKQNKTLR